jgi:outer membrane cobalamin receptor
LLDGQRVVGANVTGVPDISMFPQLLVKRVDVVNGGASATYGSDAVGGVVNFITDTRFKGFKGNVQGGVTTYGDNEQILAQAAWGTSLAGDRLPMTVASARAISAPISPASAIGIAPRPCSTPGRTTTACRSSSTAITRSPINMRATG